MSRRRVRFSDLSIEQCAILDHLFDRLDAADEHLAKVRHHSQRADTALRYAQQAAANVVMDIPSLILMRGRVTPGHIDAAVDPMREDGQARHAFAGPDGHWQAPRIVEGAAVENARDRHRAAWELVRQVREAAVQLIPTVDDALSSLAGIHDMLEPHTVDAALPMALSVMTGVLTGMHLAADVLDWLEKMPNHTTGAALRLVPNIRIVNDPKLD